MSPASIHHSFNIDLAAQYGVEKALIIHHFQYWLRFNRIRKKNIRNGKVWSYQSRPDMCAHFPYFTLDQMRRHLETLVEEGVLVTANYNRAKFDRTLWYSFADEEAFGVDEESSKKFYERQKGPTKGESASAKGQTPRPIPDPKETDSKKGSDKSSQSFVPKAKKGAKAPSPSADASEVTFLLIREIKQMKPNMTMPNFDKWVIEVDRILRRKGMTKERAQRLINWIYKDKFWRTVILSPSNLREHFDRMELQMEQKNVKSSEEKIKEMQAWIRTSPCSRDLVEAFKKNLVKISSDSVEFTTLKEGKISLINPKAEELIEHNLRKLKK